MFKVSSDSNAAKLAGAIAGTIRENESRVELNTIGAGAINQAVKAIAIARGFLAPSGYNLVCVPSFYQIEIDEQVKTGIKLVVVPIKNEGRCEDVLL